MIVKEVFSLDYYIKFSYADIIMTMNQTKAARIISYLTGPEVWFPILLLIIILKSGLTPQQIFIILPLLVIFQLLLPLGLFHYFIKTHRVSGWDLNFKQDRIRLAPIGIMAIVVGLVITYFLGNEKIFKLAAISYMVVLIIGAINKYWKISIHASLNTLAIIIINYLFNWQFPELFLIIPIVLWSRYKLKKHNLSQLISGALVTVLIIFLGFYLFRLV